MRELTLRVRAAELEEILDDVLPALPGGAHVREEDGLATLGILCVPGTPSAAELTVLAGERLEGISEAEVPDDWRERRRERYEPLVIAGRFHVRPDWAPPAGDPALTEIVLTASPAFGSGVHPTTQACIAALAGAEPRGSLLDCGCGSGVLSIAAAKLGWGPILAVDVDETSVEATRANAAANGVALDARRLDLESERPPAADAIVANVPPEVQIALAARLAAPPRLAILSGFKPDHVQDVAAAWSRAGLELGAEAPAHEWSLLVLE